MNTIFSLITASNYGAVAIIRISGSLTKQCLTTLGINKELIANKITFCTIIDNENQQILDEVLVSFFKSPHSFTGEDVAEINIHNSPYIIKRIFAILLEIKNVAIAEAGEFTKRAFLNGKIDLNMAEAIPDLINAETNIQHHQAMNQISGKASIIYHKWREELISCLAMIEASIDFPDEDLPIEIIKNLQEKTNIVKQEIKEQLSHSNIVNQIRNGLTMIIVGEPNVGKSSLINHLAQSEVAIISEIAGTTRDIIETRLDIAGMMVRILDTAGIRESNDIIEKKGIELALSRLQQADIKIIMVSFDNYDFLLNNSHLIDDNSIIVINKIDNLKQSHQNYDNISKNNLNNFFDGEYFKHNQIKNKLHFIGKVPAIAISLTNNINLDFLLEIIKDKVKSHYHDKSINIAINQRQQQALKESLTALESFDVNNNIEFIAEDLRIVAFNIGKIIGEIGVDDILDNIFSRFCIGK